MNGFISGNQETGLKALVFYVLIFSSSVWRKMIFDLPFAPFITVIDDVPSWIYAYLLLPLFLISGLLVLMGRQVSISLTAFGLILLFVIISSVNIFSNSLTFACLVILLSGLSWNLPYIINIQTSILYIGAFVNKALDVDWWNGRFFDSLATIRHPMPFYDFAHQYFNELFLAQIFSISSMLIELSLGVLFLLRKKLAFVIGFLFHLGMLVLTNGELSVRFLYIMSATYLIMLEDQATPNLLNRPFRRLLFYVWFAVLTIWNFRGKIVELFTLLM